MVGVAPDVPFDQSTTPEEQQVTLGGYRMTVRFEKPAMPANLPGLDPGQWLNGGLIIHTGDDEFIVAGTGLVVTFATESPDEWRAGILGAEKGRVDGTRWVTTQPLGGDETHQGRHVRIPPGEWGAQRVRLYRYR